MLSCQLVLAREEVQDLHKNPERFLHEQLNLVGFSGALANPLIAPEDALAKINDKIIQKFYHVRSSLFIFIFVSFDSYIPHKHGRTANKYIVLIDLT